MISPIHNWVAERTALNNNLCPETLRSFQLEKLKELLIYACNNSPFYKKKRITSTVLSQLPFTYPSELANDPLAFLAVSQSKVARITTLANSGTTRLKKRIFFTKSDLKRTKDFFAAGMSTFSLPGDHVQILISNKTENSLGSLLKESLSKIGVNSEITGVVKTVGKAIKSVYNADILVGMPAELLYMCRTVPELNLKSVLLAGDYAPQAVIDSIKKTWKCDVFTHYGHTEFGFGCAVDCKHHNGLHLRHPDLLFEIIDPITNNPASPGEVGEIVITTLSNEAMPLIRYRTGNLSCILNKPCDCGCSLPRLGKIKGRIENNIFIDGGKSINITQLDEIVFKYPNLRGYNALLKHEKKGYTLHLTIDSKGKIDERFLLMNLPVGLKLELEYRCADPFIQREKRRIRME